MSDTIFALATAPGRGAVAVIRLSGPSVADVVRRLAGALPPARKASLRPLKAPDGALLDRAILLWFPAPASYTGEDCAELQLHGGRAVVDAVTEALLDAGARLAEPGEFTRRAFENGRLDLSEAEAVADLVDAETAGQARQALDQMGGALTARHAAWRSLLTKALAMLEASVDFAEEDGGETLRANAQPILNQLTAELTAALADEARGRRVREGYRIAVIGAPNAGKSSLLNSLVGRDAAIVNARPGTTRDVLEVTLTLAGYRVILSDTAGLRESEDEIEQEGTRRARLAAADAALRLWVVDRSASDGAWRAASDEVKAGDWLILNKADLPEGADAPRARTLAASLGINVFEISALRGSGADFEGALAQRVIDDLSGTEFPAATRERHASLLRECLMAVGRADVQLAKPDLAVEDLRLAARALERVTGRIGVEDVLDRVFATFCIGK